MSVHDLCPIITQPRLVYPLWGGTRLAQWLRVAGRQDGLGESWQVFEGDRIITEPLAGRTLGEAAAQLGAALVGTRTLARYGADFPLLAKFIDAADWLSVQVHPDDAYAHSVEAATGYHGKTEAWYIIDAAPGAELMYGFKRPVSREEVTAAVADGTLERLLHREPVTAGDVVYVPAGTVHAIGPGILLFEIQQKSDLTYRVYDYNRRDPKTGELRGLHLDKALDVMDRSIASRTKITPLHLEAGRTLLVACPLFSLELWEGDAGRDLRTDVGTFEVLTVLRGAATLQCQHETQLMAGDSVVLPAGSGVYRITPAGDAAWLRAYVPDLQANLVRPLLHKGYSPAQISDTVFEE
jgi:mannose-6-phosphate isomerase